MKTLNHPFTALIMLGLVCVLASFAYGKYGPAPLRHAAMVTRPVVLTMLHVPTNRELLIELGWGKP